MSYEDIVLEKAGGVAQITLNRPEGKPSRSTPLF